MRKKVDTLCYWTQIRLVLFLAFAHWCTNGSGGVWFVNKDGDGPIRDGRNWESAFTTIQPAIDAAFDNGGGEVWVADGVPPALEMDILTGENV